MKEVSGELFDLARGKVLVITTNGFVKKNGYAVMGRGCAKQAAELWPCLPSILGKSIGISGNTVQVLPVEQDTYTSVVSFPVKYNWWENAEISLIQQSAVDLQKLTDQEGWTSVLVPRPGCGNGHLSWKDVQPVLLHVFDDRFTIVDF